MPSCMELFEGKFAVVYGGRTGHTADVLIEPTITTPSLNRIS